jgi:hypothetical protein
MGAKQTKAERQRRDDVKAKKSAAAADRIRSHVAEGAIAKPDDLLRAQIAIQQLERNDKAFTKADMVAILCKLPPAAPKDGDLLAYNSMTVPDLRYAIRQKLYDVGPTKQTIEGRPTRNPPLQTSKFMAIE